jgi:hypothetical protein
MEVIPHEISRSNYRASSYIEGRYSAVTKAEDGMSLAVVGEPRLTEICRSAQTSTGLSVSMALTLYIASAGGITGLRVCI